MPHSDKESRDFFEWGILNWVAEADSNSRNIGQIHVIELRICACAAGGRNEETYSSSPEADVKKLSEQ